ncbi:hypothetical protein [Archangium sp.]|uniref:hypothetical protein n=1 Tax=Archangium sp. TaxID=1872627 RepID=UPI00286A0AE1|nr:hypothetical protein [Archangium sp.]
MALELREFDASMTTGKRLQTVLALIERHLEGPAPARLNAHGEYRLLMVGRRVIRVVPVEAGGSSPFWECLSVVHLQSELVRRGALLRGAVTFGDAAERAAVVTGPGIFEAERLCDEVAETPRVMVDPRLFREVEANEYLHSQTVPIELGYVRSLLREDADGVWFVDYLKALKTEVREPSLYLDFLEEHRQLVERQLRQADTLNRQSRSWTWLRSYHNQVIEELYEQKVLGSAERERLRLTAQGSLVYVFPPSAKIPR